MILESYKSGDASRRFDFWLKSKPYTTQKNSNCCSVELSPPHALFVFSQRNSKFSLVVEFTRWCLLTCAKNFPELYFDANDLWSSYFQHSYFRYVSCLPTKEIMIEPTMTKIQTKFTSTANMSANVGKSEVEATTYFYPVEQCDNAFATGWVHWCSRKVGRKFERKLRGWNFCCWYFQGKFRHPNFSGASMNSWTNCCPGSIQIVASTTIFPSFADIIAVLVNFVWTNFCHRRFYHDFFHGKARYISKVAVL